MTTRPADLERLGRRLVLDELFDLSLYQSAALVPVLPVLLGARTVVVSLIAGGVVTELVSAPLAFLSGMNLRRRLITNVVILASAVAITYVIGLAARRLLGIAVP